DYIAQLIVDDGQLASPPDTALVTVSVPPPNQNPQITSSPVTTGQSGSLYTYQVIATDPDGDPLSYLLTTFPAGMTIGAGGLIHWTPASAGNFNVTVAVSDGKGGSATQSFTITVTAAVPDVVGLTAAQATANITNAGLVVGTLTQANSATVPAGNVISQNPAAGTQVASGSAVDIVVSLGPTGGGGGLPPDPSTVAPPVATGVATILSDATAFLYTGPNPIQTGVAPGTIKAVRAAVVRGKVLDKNNAALSGVTITVLNHPELGQTLSRADGMFDMAVNGGGPLTVNYVKAGHLSAQRQVNVPWQDYAIASDVILIPLDPQVSTVDLTAATPIQVAQGSTMTDADGSRKATLLFPQGTQAQMVMPNGSMQPITTLHVRATEFTVGPNGPKSMPAELPPTSGYTYEVEYSVDEAEAAGATRVSFSKPVISYTENFLNFPVGTIVPYGEYDRKKGVWIPEPNGLVIKILSVSNGVATLDLTGSGQAANATALAALGIGADELQNLASLYTAGQTLWRVPIDHFLAIK
ncbi:MAG: PASTA domain-containing protein, partial [Gammaproteobacteria bacterium]